MRQTFLYCALALALMTRRRAIADWTSQKAWQGLDLPADHALSD